MPPIDDVVRYRSPTAWDRAQHAPPQGPWWQHRKPQTDAERLEYAALTWYADPGLERALVVRERHPDVFSPMAMTVRVMETYEARRAAAVEAGKTLQLPEVDLEAIDVAAAFLRETPQRPNPLHVDREQQRRFGEVVRDGSWDEIRDAFREWQAAVREADRTVAAWFGAHETLGQGRTHGESHTPVTRFTDALDRAIGGHLPRQAAMLPDEG